MSRVHPAAVSIGAAVDGQSGHLHCLERQFELASRLSFLLWDSLPDANLFAAAAAGSLATPQQIRAQAERMLADPRARAPVSRFAKEWLQVNDLKAADRKGLSDELAAAQMRELELL